MADLWDGLCTAGWILAAMLVALVLGGIAIAIGIAVGAMYVFTMLLSAVVAVASMPVALVAIVAHRVKRD